MLTSAVIFNQSDVREESQEIYFVKYYKLEPSPLLQEGRKQIQRGQCYEPIYDWSCEICQDPPTEWAKSQENKTLRGLRI